MREGRDREERKKPPKPETGLYGEEGRRRMAVEHADTERQLSREGMSDERRQRLEHRRAVLEREQAADRDAVRHDRSMRR